jgi:N-acetylglutamate synthase-like GNAT family acetyltransferase
MTVSFIRMAKPEEAELISDLALRSKGYWGYDAAFLASCKAELSYSPSQLLSAEYCFKVAQLPNQPICGFFALKFVVSKHPELEALFVDPNFIGQGWGKHLLISVIDVATRHHAKSIKIQSDPFAEDFYLANGAIKVGESESQSIPGRFLPKLEILL